MVRTDLALKGRDPSLVTDRLKGAITLMAKLDATCGSAWDGPGVHGPTD